MPAPLAPFAGIALKYAAVAAAGFVLARNLPERAPDPRAEAALDDLDDGVGLSSGAGATRAAARWRRRVSLGGMGLALDAAILARLKVARV